MGAGRASVAVMAVLLALGSSWSGRAGASGECSCGELGVDHPRLAAERLVRSSPTVVAGVVHAPEGPGLPHRLQVTGDVRGEVGGIVEVSERPDDCPAGDRLTRLVGGEYVLFGSGRDEIELARCDPVLAATRYEASIQTPLVDPGAPPAVAVAASSSTDAVLGLDADGEVVWTLPVDTETSRSFPVVCPGGRTMLLVGDSLSVLDLADGVEANVAGSGVGLEPSERQQTIACVVDDGGVAVALLVARGRSLVVVDLVADSSRIIDGPWSVVAISDVGELLLINPEQTVLGSVMWDEFDGGMVLPFNTVWPSDVQIAAGQRGVAAWAPDGSGVAVAVRSRGDGGVSTTLRIVPATGHRISGPVGEPVLVGDTEIVRWEDSKGPVAVSLSQARRISADGDVSVLDLPPESFDVAAVEVLGDHVISEGLTLGTFGAAQQPTWEVPRQVSVSHEVITTPPVPTPSEFAIRWRPVVERINPGMAANVEEASSDTAVEAPSSAQLGDGSGWIVFTSAIVAALAGGVVVFGLIRRRRSLGSR